MRVIKVKEWMEVPSDYTGITEYPSGTKWWHLNGHIHREDGPAIERADGYKAWYLNGKFLFELPPESQPFVFIEKVVDEKGEELIKILTQDGIETWPNLPGLKECTDNWEKPSSNTIAT